jgi:uncharacterized protein
MSGLSQNGYERLGTLLTVAECRQLRSLYGEERHFRSRISMAQYRFGRGEYQYFRYPLPEVVSGLRTRLYARLAPVANEWAHKLGLPTQYSAAHAEFLAHCHAQGQARPTPLLLRYQAGDYNCLHQDLYGAVAFPFQVILALSEPGAEYEGGELLLVEQRPRAQSAGHSLTLRQGEAVAIATRWRPMPSARGYSRANLRHGVSPVTAGERFTLGIIFHDAE